MNRRNSQDQQGITRNNKEQQGTTRQNEEHRTRANEQGTMNDEQKE